MNVSSFKAIIDKFFYGIPNDINESLVLGTLLSLRNDSDFSILTETDFNSLFGKYTDFIKANIHENMFNEPFSNWSNVPDWYIDKFSYSALNFISARKRMFYLPQYLSLEIEGLLEDSLATEAWWWQLIEKEGVSYEFKNKPNTCEFDLLTEQQKSIVAFYLTHDRANGEFIYDPLNRNEYPFYWEYWHPYLKYFDSLIAS